MTRSRGRNRIDEDFVPVRRHGLASVSVDDEVVVYDGTRDSIHRLNPQASLIWACCDGSGPLREVIDEIADAYRADRTEVAGDVLAVVRDLGRLGLLEGIEGSQPSAPPSNEGDDCAPADVPVSDPEQLPSAPRYLDIPPSR